MRLGPESGYILVALGCSGVCMPCAGPALEKGDVGKDELQRSMLPHSRRRFFCAGYHLLEGCRHRAILKNVDPSKEPIANPIGNSFGNRVDTGRTASPPPPPQNPQTRPIVDSQRKSDLLNLSKECPSWVPQVPPAFSEAVTMLLIWLGVGLSRREG